ncbi:MAG: 16S rRNA (guanine(527)-N(7))-methyltransferase RsmG [Sphingomicrobium sp.]
MIGRISAAAGRDVSRETFAKLEQFAALIIEENERQNLLGATTVPDLWNRHILDGAQLLGLADGEGSWCDIGSGPGLPGLVIAILGGIPMTLIEPRRLRVDFLHHAIEKLGLERVSVEQRKAERVVGQFDFITARAVARLDRLFGLACHLAHDGTRWVLPKGESVKSELDEARATWQGSFRLVPSQTHEQAAVVVAEHVRRRGRGK